MRTERLFIQDLNRAAKWIKEGQLVAFPTETVYGLGASLFNPQAIEEIFKVKGRPSDNPLIAHVSSIDQLKEIALDIPRDFYPLAEAFFPGPLTVVLKRQPHVPSIVSAGLETLAVRMPSHPIAQGLIERVGEPIVAPSANLSGKPSATTSRHVWEDFDGKIAAVIEGGECPLGIESTVISLLAEQPLLLRPGHITQAQLEEVLKKEVKLCSSQERILSPGMKYRHYAPNAPLKLFFAWEEFLLYLAARPCLERMLLSRKPIPGHDHFDFSAKNLYDILRLSYVKKMEEICVFCDEDTLMTSLPWTCPFSSRR